MVWDLGPEEEVKTVRLIFEMRAEGYAYTDIVRELNRLEKPCPRRGRWRNLSVSWSKVTVRDIIQNEVYYGTRIYNKTSGSKILARKRGMETMNVSHYKKWKNVQSEWIVTENAHPAIVSKALWEKANLFRHQRTGSHRGYGLKSDFLLTGLVLCSRCGFPFHGKTNERKGYRVVCGWRVGQQADLLADEHQA